MQELYQKTPKNSKLSYAKMAAVLRKKQIAESGKFNLSKTPTKSELAYITRTYNKAKKYHALDRKSKVHLYKGKNKKVLQANGFKKIGGVIVIPKNEYKNIYVRKGKITYRDGIERDVTRLLPVNAWEKLGMLMNTKKYYNKFDDKKVWVFVRMNGTKWKVRFRPADLLKYLAEKSLEKYVDEIYVAGMI